MLRLLSSTAAGLFLTLASACATNAPTTATPEPTAQPQQTAAPAPAAQPAPATGIAAPATATPDGAPAQLASARPANKDFHPDDMVCKIYEKTGCRVCKQRVCKTRQQWVDEARIAREQFRALQEQGAGQGQGLDGAVPSN